MYTIGCVLAHLQLASSYDTTTSGTSSNLRNKAEAGTALSLEVSENDLRLPLLFLSIPCRGILQYGRNYLSAFSMSILYFFWPHFYYEHFEESSYTKRLEIKLTNAINKINLR